jgi:hypothetical protein
VEPVLSLNAIDFETFRRDSHVCQMDTLQSIQKMKIVKDSTYPLQTLPHDARPKTTCNILRLERTVIK